MHAGTRSGGHRESFAVAGSVAEPTSLPGNRSDSVPHPYKFWYLEPHQGFYMGAGDLNSHPWERIASILTHWAISPAPCSLFPPLWLHPIQFLPNTCHSCEPRKFILLTHHSLFSRCPTTERFPVNEAAITVSLPIFFCYWIIFPERIPQRRITFPPHPSARDWATHWPPHPQPLLDSRQAEINIVLQSPPLPNCGKYCQMTLWEALFYSARNLHVSSEHIFIFGVCQWFYLVNSFSIYKSLLVDTSPGCINYFVLCPARHLF